MNDKSDAQKLLEIGVWVAMRSVAIAVAYALLKVGQHAVRFV